MTITNLQNTLKQINIVLTQSKFTNVDSRCTCYYLLQTGKGDVMLSKQEVGQLGFL